jgi:hypothetical protein
MACKPPGKLPNNARCSAPFAPQMVPGFATLALPDSVGHYGSEEFDLSRDALKFFTSALNESYWTQVVEESGYVDAQPSVGPVPG